MSLKQKILSVLDVRIDTVNKKYAFKMGMSTEEEELREIRKKMLVLLDEVVNQIREIDNDIDAEIQKFGYEGVYPSLIPCECDLVGQKHALKKVLAVLEEEEKI